ncbi:fumarylacetoacetate hydrolase family protein [Salsuginibacillus kocurii]|uniref:fumarylacetoacetate hydrolase family protein n=1 Tax=Salsuginibacillus kocurii TaxID=427078 RepID=UPI00036D0392|nr:fumarylacetoacetate hydrolase family protein [Salsuginibacillus kocurii]
MKALAYLKGKSLPEEFDPQTENPGASANEFDILVSGDVYGVALNDRLFLDKNESTFNEKPYNQPPTAPVLYIKPKNTWAPHQTTVALPPDEECVQTGATIGVVFSDTVSSASYQQSKSAIKGLTLVNDLQLPHESVYRPAIKERARDQFCPMGPWLTIDALLEDNLATTTLETYINGELAHSFSLERLYRPLPQLISEISQFITFTKGDMLLVGSAHDAPLAKAGDHVTIKADTLGELQTTFSQAEN